MGALNVEENSDSVVNEQGQPDIGTRLAEVRSRVAMAAQASGRRPEDVTIVGVTKGFPADRARRAYELGLHDLGENRMQEWLAKLPAVGPGPRWHFIGSLQTNKVRYLGRGIQVLHSLDRPALLQAVERHWAAWSAGIAGSPGAGEDRPTCLIQVNVSGEATKGGLEPAAVYDFLAPAVEARGLSICGLMTIAPYTTNPADVRWVFSSLRELRDSLERRLGIVLPHLSMGMSADYQVAVEEGATLVRVGTAIFGARS